MDLGWETLFVSAPTPLTGVSVFAYQVPDIYRYAFLESANLDFTADATVANRFPLLQVLDVTQSWASPMSVDSAIVALGAFNVSWDACGTAYTAGTRKRVPCNLPAISPRGFVLYQTIGGVVGDILIGAFFRLRVFR